METEKMKKLLLIAAMAAITMNVALLGQSITVTAPTAGNDWCLGSAHTITWTKSGDMQNTVVIRLKTPGAVATDPPVVEISAGTANDGSFPWTVPASVPPGDYVLWVRTLDSAVIGNSGIFHISDCTTTPAITVTAPHAGSDWCLGSAHTITWTKSGAMQNTVVIRLKTPGAVTTDPPVVEISAGTANDGSFSWTVPASVPPGDYVLWVRTLDSAVIGNSGIFHISDCTTTPAITVTAPDAASSWRPGSRQTIAWTKSGTLNPMANITLRREGAPESDPPAARIADGCANNGSRVWLIPESQAEGLYFVRVKSGGVQGDSAVFALSAGGRGSDLPGPDTPIRAELEMPGIGVEYYNGHIVAWVKNNGPDSLRSHDVKFRLHFPERGSGEQILTRRITVPVGSEQGVQLLALERGNFPDAGLRTIVSIDTALSHIQDANRLNQHRDVRLYSETRPPLDLSIALYSPDTNISYVLLDAGGPFFRRYRIRATMRLRNNSDSPAEIRRVKCNWQTQLRNTFETAWREGYPRSSGSLQLGPFRRGEETTYSFEFDFIIKDFHDVVYYRVMFELDPDHLLNDPNRGNNIAVTGQFDHD
jgi:hypothetical protein